MIRLVVMLTCLSLGTSAGAATTSVSEGTATTKNPTTVPAIGGGTSINPAAQQGKSSQSGGSAANMAAAAMLMAACMATQPPNMALCMMGAMAAMQGGHDKDAAGQSAATQSASQFSSGQTNAAAAVATAPGGASDEGSLSSKKTIAAGIKTLSDAGYTATASGIKGNGQSIPASAFSSAGGMTAAGLDPNAVKEAQKVLADVNNDMGRYGKMGAVSEGGGGGGGGSGGDVQPASEESNGLPGFVNPFALTGAAKAQMMAGKTVEYDGERIGVKGDNIFQMVHTAYERKTNGQHFIETDHDPELSTRGPASLPKLLLKK